MGIINHALFWLGIKNSDNGHGLLELPKDLRDFKLGAFWGAPSYVPKSQKILIKPFTVKNQGLLETCGWNSLIGAHEIDEKIELSVRSIVSWAYKNGLCEEGGISDLRSNEKALQTFGVDLATSIHEEDFWLIGNFDGYISCTLNSSEATAHRSKTYWFVSTKDDILKLLDQGRVVRFGMMWRSVYNVGGGFKSPWLIANDTVYNKGVECGGHAMYIIGYDLNYNGHKVFIVQNSWGKEWGDEGKLYIEMDCLVSEINRYGATTNLDIDSTLGAFLNKYNCKNVKKKTESAIYYIQGGKKRPYPNWSTYLVWDSTGKNFIILNDAETKILDSLQIGTMVDKVTGLSQ